MGLDDEQRAFPLALLICALLATIAIGLALMGARLPGSALSYSGGGSVAGPYNVVTSWSPTLAANSDEFTTDTSASWTLQGSGGSGTTVLSPITTPSVSLFNFATFKEGWLFLQIESGFYGSATKAYTLPTNVAIYSRIVPGKRTGTNITGAIANDGFIGLAFSATSGGSFDASNYVSCALQETTTPATTNRTYTVEKTQAGVVTTVTGSNSVAVTPYDDLDVVIFQKRSSVYHCWVCRLMTGSCGWVGSTTWGGAATLDRTGIVGANNSTADAGPLVHGLDFFRVVEADNVLP